jgi:hypothetical protein
MTTARPRLSQLLSQLSTGGGLPDGRAVGLSSSGDVRLQQPGDMYLGMIQDSTSGQICTTGAIIDVYIPPAWSAYAYIGDSILNLFDMVSLNLLVSTQRTGLIPPTLGYGEMVSQESFIQKSGYPALPVGKKIGIIIGTPTSDKPNFWPTLLVDPTSNNVGLPEPLVLRMTCTNGVPIPTPAQFNDTFSDPNATPTWYKNVPFVGGRIVGFGFDHPNLGDQTLTFNGSRTIVIPLTKSYTEINFPNYYDFTPSFDGEINIFIEPVPGINQTNVADVGPGNGNPVINAPAGLPQADPTYGWSFQPLPSGYLPISLYNSDTVDHTYELCTRVGSGVPEVVATSGPHAPGTVVTPFTAVSLSSLPPMVYGTVGVQGNTWVYPVIRTGEAITTSFCTMMSAYTYALPIYPSS